MAAPNTQDIPHVLQNLQFPPITNWCPLPNVQQEDPSAHRQPQYHPDANVVGDPTTPDAFDNLLTQQHTGSNALSRTFMWARLLRVAKRDLGILSRLADTRSTPLFPNGPPPKINNIFSPESAAGMLYFALQQIFTKIFRTHQLDLVGPDHVVNRIEDVQHVLVEGERYDRLMWVLQNIPGLTVHAEFDEIASQPGGFSPRFLWLEDFERSLDDGIDGIRAAVNWASEPSNGSGRNRGAAITAAEQKIPEMTRLLAFLLEREGNFYNMLAIDHIFGCLTDKRLNLVSPQQLSTLHDIFNSRTMLFNWLDADSPVFRHIYGRNLLYWHLSQLQRDLRDVVQYRQIFEWGFKGLWNQLWVTVKPELGISDASIDEFLGWTTNDYQTSNFFSVLPVKTGRFQDMQCLVCLEDLEHSDEIQGKMIMELKCGHFYHPNCVIPHWDRLNHWTNRCPTCRHPAGSLRDMIGDYTAEQQDMDYELRHDARYLNERRADAVAANMTALQPNNFAPEVHEAFWRSHMYDVLELHRGPAGQPTGNADDGTLYGT